MAHISGVFTLRRIRRGLVLFGVLLAFSFSVNTIFAQRMAERAVVSPSVAFPVILDAGHGGEDGGAVAPDGTKESDVNLALTLQLRELFLLCGKSPILTRESDVSVYSEGATTLREKKVSDIHNRVAQINAVPGATLISIHQNSLPSSPRTHGAIVFFNGREGAADLAANIQRQLNCSCNETKKEEKRIPSSIYLMQNVTCPAVLVECGFLSNREELASLKDPQARFRLALAVIAGYYAE